MELARRQCRRARRANWRGDVGPVSSSWRSANCLAAGSLDTAATDLAVKQAQIGTIEAQIKRNQATLDTAKTNLDYIGSAPMAGEVTQITTLQGQTVIAAQQAPNILTLADLSTMLVKAQVSEADVIHLSLGKSVVYGAGRSRLRVMKVN